MVLLNDHLFENNCHCHKCHNKQFLNPVLVFITMLIMNLWSYMTPRVISIMSAPGSRKLWSHGRIWWQILFDIGITNKFYRQIFLSILCSEDNLFLTIMIVGISFEKICFEQSSPHHVLEWHSTIFLTFQHHLKISGTILMAPPFNLWVFFLLLATF